MEDDRETVCSLCAVGCRLAPGAEGSRAVGREGPVNTGGRLCRKGIHALERIPDDERLTTPLVRRGGSLTSPDSDSGPESVPASPTAPRTAWATCCRS